MSYNLEKIRYYNRLTQQQLADLIGVTKSYVGQIETGKSKLSKKTNQKISNLIDSRKLLNTSEEIKNPDKIVIPFYPDMAGSCGNGTLIISEHQENITLSDGDFGLDKHKKYFAIKASGDSMEKTIYDGNIVIFEQCDYEQIKDNHIYFFRYDKECYIKRLTKNIDEVIISSDNKDPRFSDRFITGENLNKIKIFGKFVALIWK